MKEEALVMTIDFGKNHFNAIYLNNQLKLISSNGSMITVAGPEQFEAPEETRNISTHLAEFFKH
jgi:hypothetical protein